MRLLERRRAVPFVQEIDVDDVGPQPLQAVLAFADQMIARQAFVVGAVAHPHARLGGDQHVALALAVERLADDLLRDAGSNRHWRCR